MGKKEKNQMTNTNVVKGKKKHKKTIVIIVVIVLLLLIVRMVSCAGNAGAAAMVTTTQAMRGELQESISTSGLVESEEKKVYFAPVAGTVDTVNVAVGDAVNEGTVLIGYKLDDMESMMNQAKLQQRKSEAVYNEALSNNSDSQGKLNEANVNLEVLNRQITDWKANLKKLQQQLDETQRGTSNALAGENYNLTNRISALQKEMGQLDETSQEYADKAAELAQVQEQLNRNQYIQSVAGTSDQVALLQQEIARVQEELAGFEEYKARMESQKASSENTVMSGYARTQFEVDNELSQMTYQDAADDYDTAVNGIRAVFDGVVTECSIVSGAPVMEGAQLLTLESSEAVKITFQASKTDIQKLAVGQKTDIVISGHSYEGEISKINRMASLGQSGTPMVGVEVHISNPDDNIILGLDAKLYIYTNYVEDALMVPVEAVNADKEGDFLYVVEDGVVVRKPIVCGITSDNYVEIKEGISEEDQIVLTAYTEIEEGMAVAVLPQMQ